MTKRGRVTTQAEDAARILRDYKDRIERLEEGEGAGSESVQLFRTVSETAVCSDSVSVSSSTAGSFEWNTSNWGFADWEDN